MMAVGTKAGRHFFVTSAMTAAATKSGIFDTFGVGEHTTSLTTKNAILGPKVVVCVYH